MHSTMDKTILYSLKKGEESAFKVLFDQYHKKIFYVGRKMGLSVEEAEDIVQESFIQLWRQRESIDSEKNIGGLIKIIAKRLIYKKYSKLRLMRELFEQNLDEQSIIDYESSKDEEENVDKEILLTIINNLPRERKKILNLYYTEGLSAKEIAEYLNISVRTVENQLYRTKKDIKKKMNK